MLPPSRSPFRLRWAQGRLLCCITLPPAAGAPLDLQRDLVLVADPAARRLRRLTIHRRARRAPVEPPRAA